MPCPKSRRKKWDGSKNKIDIEKEKRIMSMKERNNKVVNMVESIPAEVSDGQKKLFNIVMENIKSFSTSK